jgi:hypothetical protein
LKKALSPSSCTKTPPETYLAGRPDTLFGIGYYEEFSRIP